MDEITEAELHALLGEPARAALAEERAALHDLDRAWLAARDDQGRGAGGG
ncbi:hypothetical protein [Blastococcus sp. SYSU DS0533]